jgi:nitroreductase
MNKVLETIHNLRSIHGNFTSREITESDLKTILEAAVQAATASARQSYSIIIVDDHNDMREYLQYAGSKALIFCVDYTRLVATAEYLNYHLEKNGVIDFITGSTDTILAAQTAAIAAKSLGIDSLFTNSIHRKDLSKFYQKFNLPSQYCFPLITLILGYAREENHPQRGRLSGPGVIHFQKYKNLSDVEIQKIVDDYNDPARNMGLVFRPETIKTSYMDWFFNIWLKPENEQQNHQKQTEIFQLLKDSGFLDTKG